VNPLGLDLLDQFMAWAGRERSIIAVAVFGSRARCQYEADEWSDVDLHVTTTEPELLTQREWTSIFSGHELWAFAVRPASGGVAKVTLIFRPGREVDIVVVPAIRFRLARWLVSFGLHRRSAAVAQALNEMATVMRQGHRVLKGGKRWEEFYLRVVTEVRGTRLGDEDAQALAEAFVCDYTWIKRKLRRGECVAAQRVLHRSLAEINFRLMHEVRLRRGNYSFREARRVEQLLSPEELAAVTVAAQPTVQSLITAAEHCAATCRTLMQSLVGQSWTWPKDLL
jgi:hypothetical protein